MRPAIMPQTPATLQGSTTRSAVQYLRVAHSDNPIHLLKGSALVQRVSVVEVVVAVVGNKGPVPARVAVLERKQPRDKGHANTSVRSLSLYHHNNVLAR